MPPPPPWAAAPALAPPYERAGRTLEEEEEDPRGEAWLEEEEEREAAAKVARPSLPSKREMPSSGSMAGCSESVCRRISARRISEKRGRGRGKEKDYVYHNRSSGRRLKRRTKRTAMMTG